MSVKVVVGIDLAGSFRPALDLVARLSFPESTVHLLNVVEPVMPDGAFPELTATHPMAQILEDLLEAGRQTVADVAKASKIPATTEVALGLKVSSLIGVAKEHAADLIAVGAQQKTMLEAMFTGHVTRALASDCPLPVLIAKKAPQTAGPMTLVVAHDLSAYCDRVVEKLVSWRPAGVGRIILVTADTTDPSIVAVAEQINPELAGETLDKIHAKLEERHRQIAHRLEEFGVPVDTVLSEGEPREVIGHTMRDTRADLLVMGAQGHGFVERLLVGSVALHEVVKEPYNVLLMRA